MPKTAAATAPPKAIDENVPGDYIENGVWRGGESTIVALANLYPRLSPGGFVIIDDYGAIEACRKAVTDYRREQGISAIHAVDWTGVWWQKPQ